MLSSVEYHEHATSRSLKPEHLSCRSVGIFRSRDIRYRSFNLQISLFPLISFSTNCEYLGRRKTRQSTLPFRILKLFSLTKSEQFQSLTEVLKSEVPSPALPLVAAQIDASHHQLCFVLFVKVPFYNANSSSIISSESVISSPFDNNQTTPPSTSTYLTTHSSLISSA